MRVSRSEGELRRPSVVAFGVFDGLHRGHQALVSEVVRRARAVDAAASIITFDPHPALVLAPPRAPLLINTLEQRLEGLALLGVDQVSVLAFDTEAASESATSFIERVLVGQLGVIELVAGDDMRFGHDREGDVVLLEKEGVRLGFGVQVSPTYGGAQRFSSTTVRAMVAEGDVVGAAEILGRPFVVRGTVMHGDGRGRELGFATANLQVDERQLLPAKGIYAAAVHLASGEWRCGAVSVGTRPQFYESGALLVEVHLPQFSGDLYDQVLDVAFLERLRDEAKFSSVEELTEQIDRDVATSEAIFHTFSPEASLLLG